MGRYPVRPLSVRALVLRRLNDGLGLIAEALAFSPRKKSAPARVGRDGKEKWK